jgi:hypothetical protein
MNAKNLKYISERTPKDLMQKLELEGEIEILNVARSEGKFYAFYYKVEDKKAHILKDDSKIKPKE